MLAPDGTYTRCRHCGADMKFNPCCGRVEGLEAKLAEARTPNEYAAGLAVTAELMETKRVRSVWYDRWSKVKAKLLDTEAREAKLREALTLALEDHAIEYGHDDVKRCAKFCDICRAALATSSELIPKQQGWCRNCGYAYDGNICTKCAEPAPPEETGTTS